MVKNLPTMQERQIPPLGHEDPLVKGMETHSSILAWRIPWTEEPDGLLSMRSQTVDMAEQLTLENILLYLNCLKLLCDVPSVL